MEPPVAALQIAGGILCLFGQIKKGDSGKFLAKRETIGGEYQQAVQNASLFW
jgi:hypothetical protein